MNNTALDTVIDYADFAEYDRRQRAIEHHLIAAFLGGLAVGLIGMLISGRVPTWIGRLYEPYAYLALTLAVGASASGYGWALLTTFLAAVSTLVAAMGASAFRGDVDFDLIGGVDGFHWPLALIVGLGLLAYVTRRDDGWGDLAAGAAGAVLIADVVGRAAPGLVTGEPAFWPLPGLSVGLLAVALVVLLRRNARGRLRALALSAVLSGLLTVGLTDFAAGWIPLAGPPGL